MNDTQHIINRCSRAERPFLYIMVFITMITSCSNSDKLDRLKHKMETMTEQIGK